MKTITHPIFSVQELLDASGTNLETESDALGAQNTSMRDSGIILLITLSYSNEETDLPEFEMQVSRVAFSEYKITHLERLNETNVNIVGLHGIKLVFQQTGKIVRFDFQVLLISIVASAALLAAATSVVEFVMLKVSPLRAVYAEAKFERTMEIHELEELKQILKKEPAMRGVGTDRLLQLSQFAYRQYQSLDRKPNCSKDEIGAITRSIHTFRQDNERREAEEQLRLAQMADRVKCCGCCFPRPKPKQQEEEGVQLTDKQFTRTQHEKVFQLLSDGQGVVPQQKVDLLLAVGGADSTAKKLLAEQGLQQGDLDHDQIMNVLTFMGQLEKVKSAAGVPCVSLFSDEDALDRLYDKLLAQMNAIPVFTPGTSIPTSPSTSRPASPPPLEPESSSRGICRQS